MPRNLTACVCACVSPFLFPPTVDGRNDANMLTHVFGTCFAQVFGVRCLSGVTRITYAPTATGMVLAHTGIASVSKNTTVCQVSPLIETKGHVHSPTPRFNAD